MISKRGDLTVHLDDGVGDLDLLERHGRGGGVAACLGDREGPGGGGACGGREMVAEAGEERSERVCERI